MTSRPALRYHGGKNRLAKQIIPLMPDHRVYVEPYGGGASVLLQKPRINAEIYNDLDGRVVNVFRVLQSPVSAAELRHRLDLTPYARAEFDRCYEPPVDAVDAAAKTIMLSQMGYGTDSIGRTCRTGFRSKLSGSGFAPSMSWASWPREIPAFVERLQGVVIECRDAVEVIHRMDSHETLFYVDPPYPHSTRSSLSEGRGSSHGYRHEMTDLDHVDLSDVLHRVEGMVMISGYHCDLYDGLYAGWRRVEFAALADGARPRTECLWLNPAADAGSQLQGVFLQEATCASF